MYMHMRQIVWEWGFGIVKRVEVTGEERNGWNNLIEFGGRRIDWQENGEITGGENDRGLQLF